MSRFLSLLSISLLCSAAVATEIPPIPALPFQPQEEIQPVSEPPAPPPATEIRGLWVDAFGKGLKTRAQIEQMIEDATKLSINTLFVQVIRRGDCLCQKSTLPLATDKNLEKGLDPLQLVTELAHARGIKVIAWVSVTGIANVSSPSLHPEHVMRTHGDKSADSWLARRPDGTWKEGNDGWLDVGIPAAAEYATSAVVSLVKNYQIDGIQLDRIRYPDGGAWGYDPKTLQRYRQETGKKGIPAAHDPVWQAWKREQVTALVRRITFEVKTLRPDAWVSAATIVYGAPPLTHTPKAFTTTRAYNDVLQDWLSWIEQGLIDLNVPMNYKRDHIGQQATWFDGWNQYAATVPKRADGQKSHLAIGTALYLNTPQVSAAQINRALLQQAGWVGYAYRSLTPQVLAGQPHAQGVQQLLQHIPMKPTNGLGVPPTARGVWGQITSSAGQKRGGYPVEAWLNNVRIARVNTDGNGYYGFLALPEGTIEIRALNQKQEVEIPTKGIVRLPELVIK